jgi:hypothetical protein
MSGRFFHDPEPEMAWWASESETLRVRWRVQASRVFGATFVIWIGQRVVEHGWRPSTKLGWRAVTHYLDVLNVGSESSGVHQG